MLLLTVSPTIYSIHISFQILSFKIHGLYSSQQQIRRAISDCSFHLPRRDFVFNFFKYLRLPNTNFKILDFDYFASSHLMLVNFHCRMMRRRVSTAPGHQTSNFHQKTRYASQILHGSYTSSTWALFEPTSGTRTVCFQNLSRTLIMSKRFRIRVRITSHLALIMGSLWTHNDFKMYVKLFSIICVQISSH